MAVYIGGERSLDNMTRETFADAAREIGANPAIVIRHFDDLLSRFVPALSDAAQVLEQKGFGSVKRIKDDILDRGGIAKQK